MKILVGRLICYLCKKFNWLFVYKKGRKCPCTGTIFEEDNEVLKMLNAKVTGVDKEKMMRANRKFLRAVNSDYFACGKPKRIKIVDKF